MHYIYIYDMDLFIKKRVVINKEIILPGYFNR